MSAFSLTDSVVSCCLWLYAGLLRLYPDAFRREFEPEMRAAFVMLLREEQAHGGFGFLLACLRELRDVPLAALRLHLSGEPRRRPAVPAVPPSSGGHLSRSFAVAGYLLAYGAASLAPTFIQGSLRLVRADAVRCVSMAAAGRFWDRHLWDCHSLQFLLAPGLLLYYAVCGCSGAAAGALIGGALRGRAARAKTALAGFLTFSVAALAAERWLPPYFHSEFLSAIGNLSIGIIFMGLYLGAASRDWRLLFRLAARGPAALAVGGLLGTLIAMLLWGLAQAWASYQAATVYAWVLQNVPLAMPGILRAIAGATWGMAIARLLARRPSLSPGAAG